MSTTPSVAEHIDSLTREGVELMAARLLRLMAKQAVLNGRRNIATATREAAQLSHLAGRLEAFSEGRNQ